MPLLSDDSAGVTEHSAGVTERSARVTEHSARVTERSAGVTEHSAGVTEHSAGVSIGRACYQAKSRTLFPIQQPLKQAVPACRRKAVRLPLIQCRKFGTGCACGKDTVSYGIPLSGSLV
ncbi:MAG: hypothetical protein LBB43_04850 [Spirochaetaceae bacterium]|nr:hypothetical protein [Spirochaetaceae bacterium]